MWEKKKKMKNSLVMSSKLDSEIWMLLPPQINGLLQVVWYRNKLPLVVGKNQEPKKNLNCCFRSFTINENKTQSILHVRTIMRSPFHTPRYRRKKNVDEGKPNKKTIWEDSIRNIHFILRDYEFEKHYYESNEILPIQSIIYLLSCQIINKLCVLLMFLR